MIDLSRYVLETLREDMECILYRGRSEGDSSQVLVLAPILDNPALGSLKRIEHEFSLRAELDPSWAARPLAFARHEGRTMLVLEDPGGECLDQLLGRPLELTWFLRIAISLAASLGRLHERGILHKDVKPASGCLHGPTHPLALFLDDLQWLDTATLALLEHLVTEAEVGHLLLVGA